MGKKGQISFRADPELKKHLNQEADRLGIKMSEYLRLIAGKRGVSKIRMPDGSWYDAQDLRQAEVFLVHENNASDEADIIKQGGPTGS